MVSVINEEEEDEHPRVDDEEEEQKPRVDESESSPLRSNESLSKDRRTRGFSPLRSPKTPTHQPQSLQDLNPSSPVIVYNQSIHNDAPVVSKVDPGGATHRRGDVEEGEKKSTTTVSGVWRERREAMVNRALLGFRACGVLFCLISFSVMAADNTRGWAGDSFDRYKEYRYCLSVSVIGFVYAGFQVVDLVRYRVTTRHFIQTELRYHFDFCMDQIHIKKSPVKKKGKKEGDIEWKGFYGFKCYFQDLIKQSTIVMSKFDEYSMNVLRHTPFYHFFWTINEGRITEPMVDKCCNSIYHLLQMYRHGLKGFVLNKSQPEGVMLSPRLTSLVFGISMKGCNMENGEQEYLEECDMYGKFFKGSKTVSRREIRATIEELQGREDLSKADKVNLVKLLIMYSFSALFFSSTSSLVPNQ